MGLLDKAIQLKEKDPQFSLEENQLTEEIIEPRQPIDENWEGNLLKEYKEVGFVKKETLLEASPLKGNQLQKNQDFLIKNSSKLTLPLDLSYVYQNRIDALLSLIDFTKELSSIEDEDDLWNSVILGVLGQIVSKEAAIFYKYDDSFYLKASHGFDFNDNVSVLTKNSIEKISNKESGIYYVKELINSLEKDEKKFLNNTIAELFVPIIKYEEVVGFILVGKPLGEVDYNIDDLLFLKILGELLGAFQDSIHRITYISEQKHLWNKREKKTQAYLSYLELLEKESNEDKIIKELAKILQDSFSLGMYAFLTGEEDTFSSKFSYGLSQKTLDQFNISITDTWVMESRLQSGWFEYNDFRDDLSLVEKFSEDDFAIVENMYILPFKFKKKLQAIFVLFEVNKTLNNEDLKSIQSILQSTYWFFITNKISKDKKIWNTIAMQEPLFALKKEVQNKENDKISYACISIQVINSGRLENIFEKQILSSIKTIIKESLSEYLYKNDFFGEIFSYHFLAMIDDVSSDIIRIIESTIKNEIKSHFVDDEIRPILRIKSMLRPQEKLIDIEEFLFD